MRRTKVFTISIILAIVLIGIEVILIRSASNFEPEVRVVYAKTFIAEKTIIEPDMLAIRSIPVKMLNRQSVFSIEDVAGKAVIDIQNGEQLLKSKFSSKYDTADIKVLNKNNRLFTVEFKIDQANGWQLKADEYVDILYVPISNNSNISTEANKHNIDTYSNEANKHNINTYSNEVVRINNVRIAAVIDEFGNLMDNTTRTSVSKMISFEVNTKQDAALAYAKGNGRLELSLIPS